MYLKKNIILCFLGFLTTFTPQAFGFEHKPDSVLWLDSVLNTLSVEEKIGQMLNIRVMSGRDEKYYTEIENLIQNYSIGGITFFKGTPQQQVRLTQRFQQKVRIPLMIAMDAETGPAMRLDGVVGLPDMMLIGATGNENHALMAGKIAGEQCKRLGVQLNFAPVADVNTNPANPVIGPRAFGENPEQVARMAGKYLEGLHQSGVLGCLKHFPGHGEAETDSHYALPVIQLSTEKIQNESLRPFVDNILKTDAIMMGHLFIPVLDTHSLRPASLSQTIIGQILRNQLNFGGLIITDAMDMEGAGKASYPGELEVEAVIAGNDIILLPKNPEEAIKAIRKAVESGQISIQEIDSHCRRILAYKFKLGLWAKPYIPQQNLIEELNKPEYLQSIKQMYFDAITVCGDTSLIPYQPQKHPWVAVVSIFQENPTLQEITWLFADAGYFNLLKPDDTSELKFLTDTLQYYDLVIYVLNIPSKFQTKNYGLTARSIAACNILINQLPSITILLGNGYAARNFIFPSKGSAQVFAWQNNTLATEAALRVVFGEKSATGKLPATFSERFKLGEGYRIEARPVLGFSEPQEVGVDPDKLLKIDEIAQEGIQKGCYPGCQILLARNGKVFYYKAFGNHDVVGSRPVSKTDLYDLASVTKIAATTLAVMKLFEDGIWDNDTKMKEVIPHLSNHKLRNIHLEDVLRHQAGLYPWVPFYKKILQKGEPSPRYFSNNLRPGFEIPVAKNLYLRNDYVDSIISFIDKTPLSPPGKFIYSDLGFILLKFGIERVTQQPFAEFLEENFYKPMGLASLQFNPAESVQKNRLIPTSIDTEFRKQLLRGYVHDPAAALLGGISGHAGLFSHAMDLARIMQMLLWKGYYNGIQFFKPETIKRFTSYGPHPERNRRGLGFDKPPVQFKTDGLICRSASNNSFGHSGFTGTFVWADPDQDLIYVFLSNRIHPDEDNKLINQLNIRTRIHQAAYDAIIQ